MGYYKGDSVQLNTDYPLYSNHGKIPKGTTGIVREVTLNGKAYWVDFGEITNLLVPAAWLY